MKKTRFCKKYRSLIVFSVLLGSVGMKAKKIEGNPAGEFVQECAPYATPEDLNAGYMQQYAWRFEQFDTEPMRPSAQNIFQAHARFAPGKNVLDIGAGPGHYAAWIAAQGFSVQCIDKHAVFEQYCTAKGLPFTCSSVTEYNPVTPYDIVVGIGWPFSYVRPEDASEVIKHIATRLLAQNGIAILTFFMGCGATYEDPMNVGHKRYFVHYTETECRALCEPWFEIVSKKEHFLNSIKKDARIFVLKKK
jgi:hypothetical protein